MNLYLSRLLLSMRSRQVISEWIHPYEMHRTLLRAFPRVEEDIQTKARERFGVLFRAEEDFVRKVIKVYVQSRVEPDWSVLADAKDYLFDGTDPASYEYKDVLPAYRRIAKGQVLSFRLRANPTRRIGKRDDPMRGKRVELQREEEQTDWLIRKGKGDDKENPGGFELVMRSITEEDGRQRLMPRLKITGQGKKTGCKWERNGGQKVTHMGVLFDGLLQVTDAGAFLETLTCGVGSGKAFGFGLLSIAPADTDFAKGAV